MPGRPSGRSDRSFAVKGIKRFPFAPVDALEVSGASPHHVALDARGRIVIAGEVYDSDFVSREDQGTAYPAIARLNG